MTELNVFDVGMVIAVSILVLIGACCVFVFILWMVNNWNYWKFFKGRRRPKR
jgi:hypothetical protein